MITDYATNPELASPGDSDSSGEDIHIPDDVLAKLEHSLLHDEGRAEAQVNAERDRLTQRLVQVRGRLERAYADKLDGKITEEFWGTRFAAWNQEEQQILFVVRVLEHHASDCTFEL